MQSACVGLRKVCALLLLLLQAVFGLLSSELHESLELYQLLAITASSCCV